MVKKKDKYKIYINVEKTRQNRIKIQRTGIPMYTILHYIIDSLNCPANFSKDTFLSYPKTTRYNRQVKITAKNLVK